MDANSIAEEIDELRNDLHTITTALQNVLENLTRSQLDAASRLSSLITELSTAEDLFDEVHVDFIDLADGIEVTGGFNLTSLTQLSQQYSANGYE